MNGRAFLRTFIQHTSACHESLQVEETFISAVSLETTRTEDITNTAIGELRKFGLKPETSTLSLLMGVRISVET